MDSTTAFLSSAAPDMVHQAPSTDNDPFAPSLEGDSGADLFSQLSNAFIDHASRSDNVGVGMSGQESLDGPSAPVGFEDSSPSMTMQQRNAARRQVATHMGAIPPHLTSSLKAPGHATANSSPKPLFDAHLTTSPPANGSPQTHPASQDAAPANSDGQQRAPSIGGQSFWPVDAKTSTPQTRPSALQRAVRDAGGLATDGNDSSLQSPNAFGPSGGDADGSPAAASFRRGDDIAANLSFPEQDTPPPGDLAGQDGADATAEKRQSSRFVYKLMRMVSDPESQHLISFNTSGTSVVVTNFDDFAKEVLPKHFKHSNFSSFIRQLNMYGFYKVNKTPRGQRNATESQIWEFSHPKFLRGRPDLLEDIRRKALDTEHARVEARDLRFNVSLGQLQIRQHLEEMQWRLDQTMEQNLQLRDISQALRSTLINVLEYLKASNGGSLPFDVHLPRMDLGVSPSLPPSPFAAAGGGWSGPPPPPPPTMQQGGPSNVRPPQPQQAMPQQGRPSILVTEPHHSMQTQLGGPSMQQQMQSPLSPQDANGPFSMSGLGQVSPFGSRRVSSTSSTGLGDRPDMSGMGQGYFAASPLSVPGVGPGQQTNDNLIMSPGGSMSESDPAFQGSGSAVTAGREAFANLPRRTMSGRGGPLDGTLNTQAAHHHGGQQQPHDSAPLSAGVAAASAAFAMPETFNPGLGVMAPHTMPPSPLFADHLSAAAAAAAAHQQQNHLHAAVNTPLPPSPAVPGYTGHGQGFGGAAAFAQGGGVSPSMLTAPSFDRRAGGHLSAPTSPVSPVDGQFGLFPPTSGICIGPGDMNTVDGSTLDPSSQDPRKVMRTPLKRTASGHSESMTPLGPTDVSAFGLGSVNGLGSAGKRKSPH
ncbi:unnamed protein product [Parajaminaea phylloscopi]